MAVLNPEEVNALRRAYNAAGRGIVRRSLRRLMPDGEVSVDGMTLYLEPQKNFTDLLLWTTQTWSEPKSVEALTQRIAGKRSLILDLGANSGAFTLPLARAAGEGSCVVAFEPNPAVAARLARNVYRNGLGDRVHIVPAAAGNGEELGLEVNAANQGQTTTRAPREGLAVIRSEPVKAHLERVEKPEAIVLKADIEGYEDKALVPFLESCPDELLPELILIETDHDSQWEQDLYGALENKGYRTTEKMEGNTLFELSYAPSGAPKEEA
ncbi:MAG: FkbM family methyltransferase [Rubricella sp.]